MKLRHIFSKPDESDGLWEAIVYVCSPMLMFEIKYLKKVANNSNEVVFESNMDDGSRKLNVANSFLDERFV